MKKHGCSNQKSPTRFVMPSTPYGRLCLRRPSPQAAELWWQRLTTWDKAAFHQFVRRVQVATPTEALDAVEHFRDMDTSFLREMRNQKARYVRRQRRFNRALRTQTPKLLPLAA